jgi:hypothetical protein
MKLEENKGIENIYKGKLLFKNINGRNQSLHPSFIFKI